MPEITVEERLTAGLKTAFGKGDLLPDISTFTCSDSGDVRDLSRSPASAATELDKLHGRHITKVKKARDPVYSGNSVEHGNLHRLKLHVSSLSGVLNDFVTKHPSWKGAIYTITVCNELSENLQACKAECETQRKEGRTGTVPTFCRETLLEIEQILDRRIKDVLLDPKNASLLGKLTRALSRHSWTKSLSSLFGSSSLKSNVADSRDATASRTWKPPISTDLGVPHQESLEKRRNPSRASSGSQSEIAGPNSSRGPSIHSLQSRDH